MDKLQNYLVPIDFSNTSGLILEQGARHQAAIRECARPKPEAERICQSKSGAFLKPKEYFPEQLYLEVSSLEALNVHAFQAKFPALAKTSIELDSFERELFHRLQECELYQRYCEAFRVATGLPLRLMRRDERWCLNEHRENQSPFCELLQKCEAACLDCVETNHRLMTEAEVEGPMTCACFAGLCATAVPIKLGSHAIGFLKTGQIFHRQPTEKDFARTATSIAKNGVRKADLSKLHEAYFQTQSVDPKRYDSMIALLESFASQLSAHTEDLAIVIDGREPEAISRARAFIHAHLDEPLPLGEVARQAGLSESHFCRVFKEIIGMTLTDYVSRSRISWARKELLRPSARISEIAFQVGFQSLSQFNRAFAKIVGCSPSKYREAELAKFSN